MTTAWLKHPAALLLLMTVLATSASAAEYFVRTDGNDAQDGRTLATAFATIQQGVRTLQPGDTLTIAPGEYAEIVQRDQLGSPDAATTIRAAIPGTVLLRGDVPAPTFAPVDGYRFVYSAEFNRPAFAVNEVNSLTIYEPAGSIADLEFLPGSMFYNDQAKRLYISTSDMQPPATHHYTVSVVNNHGLFLHQPVRVIVEGISVTGFRRNGVMLASAKSCIIRNCIAFLNASGLVIDSATWARYHLDANHVPVYAKLVPRKEGADGPGGNIMERCQGYGNASRRGGSGGNLIIFNSHDDTIRQCIAHTSSNKGIRQYGAITGPARMQDNLTWDNNHNDVKGGRAPEFGHAERCVSLDPLFVHHLTQVTIGRENRYNANPDESVVRYDLEAFSTRYEEFADPDNFDFRLQATSRFRGSGPNGSDRGAFPYQDNIYYVTPRGDDQADGRSIRHAFQTLQRAVNVLRPGDTLYLDPGTYEADLVMSIQASDASPVRLRGRGTGLVIMRGAWRITNSRQLMVERVTFTQPIDLQDSSQVAFNNCRIVALDASGVEGLKVTQSEFTGFKQAAIALSKSSNLFLAGNVFDNHSAPAVKLDSADAVRYADYNSYRDPARAWVTSASAASAQFSPHDRYSRSLTPEFELNQGIPTLVNRSRFAAGGPHGMPLGTYADRRSRALRTSDPMARSVTPHSADIEWWTSAPARCELRWADSVALDHRTSVNTDCYGTFSLTGLKPDTTYHVQVAQAQALAGNSGYLHVRTATSDDQAGAVATPPTATISFTTPGKVADPAVYHVAPQGNDTNSGLSDQAPLRTLQHAANLASAGDTVLISEGIYQETVRVRSTGLPGKPITFRAAPGQKVVLDGNNQTLNRAFMVNGKDHIHFDGMYFENFLDSAGETSGIFVLYMSNHIQITRCFYNGNKVAYAPSFVKAMVCESLVVRNCTSLGAFYGSLYLIRCPGALIENNVLMRSRILQAVLVNEPGQIVTFQKNIVTDNQPTKLATALIEVSTMEALNEGANCYYLRVAPDDRNMFMLYDAVAYGRTVESLGLRTLAADQLPGTLEQITLGAFQRKSGNATSMAKDPLFSGAADIPRKTDKAAPLFTADHLVTKSNPDFTDFFATDPDVVSKGIGLQPEAFEDFHFNRKGTSAQ